MDHLITENEKKLAIKIVDDILEIIKQTDLKEKIYTNIDYDRMEFCREKVMENVNGYRKSIC